MWSPRRGREHRLRMITEPDIVRPEYASEPDVRAHAPQRGDRVDVASHADPIAVTHHLAGRSWIRLVHCAGAHRDRYLWARAGVFGASAAHVVSQVGRVTPRCGVDLQCHEVDGDVEDHVDGIEEPDDRERTYSGLGPL